MLSSLISAAKAQKAAALKPSDPKTQANTLFTGLRSDEHRVSLDTMIHSHKLEKQAFNTTENLQQGKCLVMEPIDLK